MLNKFKNKQADLDDDEFKKCGIEIYDLYDRSASQINQQSLLPVPVSPVQVSQVPFIDPAVQVPVLQVPPVQVIEQPVETNQYNPEAPQPVTVRYPEQMIIPEPVTTPENNNQMNNQLKLYISNIGDGRYCGSFLTTNGRIQPLVFDQLSFNIKRQQNCTYDIEVMLYLNGKSLQERVALFKGISSAPGGDNEHRNLMISVKGKIIKYLTINANGGEYILSTEELNKLVPNSNQNPNNNLGDIIVTSNTNNDMFDNSFGFDGSENEFTAEKANNNLIEKNNIDAINKIKKQENMLVK